MLLNLLAAVQTDPATPIFIKIEKPPSDIEGLGSVLLGALGIAGAITAAALVMGIVAAAVIYTVRKVQSAHEQDADPRL